MCRKILLKEILKLATSTLRFANNNILEIGVLPIQIIASICSASGPVWNLDTEAVSNFNNYAREFSLAIIQQYFRIYQYR